MLVCPGEYHSRGVALRHLLSPLTSFCLSIPHLGQSSRTSNHRALLCAFHFWRTSGMTLLWVHRLSYVAHATKCFVACDFVLDYDIARACRHGSCHGLSECCASGQRPPSPHPPLYHAPHLYLARALPCSRTPWLKR